MAASILAKSERDSYIMELCECHPELDERYKILKIKDTEQKTILKESRLMHIRNIIVKHSN